jgi:hypothetical protein
VAAEQLRIQLRDHAGRVHTQGRVIGLHAESQGGSGRAIRERRGGRGRVGTVEVEVAARGGVRELTGRKQLGDGAKRLTAGEP